MATIDAKKLQTGPPRRPEPVPDLVLLKTHHTTLQSKLPCTSKPPLSRADSGGLHRQNSPFPQTLPFYQIPDSKYPTPN
ncbi:Nuclear pore complex protein [Corchorus olitorius]|uniref:Nuclear pore complex protein n=1 Tax=Corchorus olitorius TaxID=93759 RepID=A0A1R3JVK3_9ROSI|nr:Nuclear pore complex protein [Corchorus olitorius]